MSRLMKCQRQQHPVLAESGSFLAELWPFGRSQPHSCLHPLQKPVSGHPNIGGCKQGDELRSVFLGPKVTHFGVTELAFDHPKRVFHLGARTSFEFLSLLCERSPRGVLLLLSLTGTHGNVPIHTGCLVTPGRALIARISEDSLLITMQQSMSLGDIVDVGCGANNGVH